MTGGKNGQYKTMRIVHLVNYFQYKLGYQEYYLAKVQADLGHEVYVITSNRYFPFYNYENTVQNILGPRFFKPGEKKIQGFTLINLPIIYEQPARRVWLKGLKKRLKRIKPDLVHSHGEFTFLTAQSIFWKKKFGYRLVIDSHSHPHDSRRYKDAKKSKAFFIQKMISFLLNKFYKKFIFTRTDVKWIATTEWNRKYLIEKYGFSTDVLMLIPNGSDVEIFHPDPNVRKEKRKEFNIDDKDIVILYTGLISEFKGVHKIIQASKKFLSQFNLKYVFVGNIDTQFREKFLNIIGEVKKSVVLHKAVNNKDLPPFYQMADIACWPMESSLSAVDAMASALPIIVCEKLSERLKNNNGFGVSEVDVSQLSNALEKLITNKDLRDAMGKNGLELVQREMNWKYISRRFIEVAFFNNRSSS